MAVDVIRVVLVAVAVVCAMEVIDAVVVVVVGVKLVMVVVVVDVVVVTGGGPPPPPPPLGGGGVPAAIGVPPREDTGMSPQTMEPGVATTSEALNHPRS